MHTTFKKLARTLQKAGATPEEIRALRQTERHETTHQEDLREDVGRRSKKRGGGTLTFAIKKKQATPTIKDAWFNFPPNTNTREAINSAGAPARRGMKLSKEDKAILTNKNLRRQNPSHPDESHRHDH